MEEKIKQLSNEQLHDILSCTSDDRKSMNDSINILNEYGILNNYDLSYDNFKIIANILDLLDKEAIIRFFVLVKENKRMRFELDGYKKMEDHKISLEDIYGKTDTVVS